VRILSAGILLYRYSDAGLQVWIAHMGGPFWARKDAGAWSIPKGEYLQDEDPLAAARREFAEEMGTPAPSADYTLLGSFRQSSGKTVTVFAAEADFRPERILSNTFPLEWPKGSGRIRDFPEVDDAGWFTLSEARTKLVRGQLPVLDSLILQLRGAES
jgi:predicted NUDIX family NTP pyrophosphohydrolase